MWDFSIGSSRKVKSGVLVCVLEKLLFTFSFMRKGVDVSPVLLFSDE